MDEASEPAATIGRHWMEGTPELLPGHWILSATQQPFQLRLGNLGSGRDGLREAIKAGAVPAARWCP